MGRERVIGCWELDGVLIDPGPQSSEDTLIEALGGEAPRAIVLTHIHLDHAGAAGSLVRRWPGTPVYVHERGAPHLIDPSRLWASAGQLWDDMDERWGEAVPVPEENITLVGEGDTVFGMRVAYTPGHASHHVSYFHEDSGRAFVGDVARRARPARGPHADADAAAGHRRGGVAGLDRDGRVMGAAVDRDHPLRRPRGRRRNARGRAHGAAPLGRGRARRRRGGVRPPLPRRPRGARRRRGRARGDDAGERPAARVRGAHALLAQARATSGTRASGAWRTTPSRRSARGSGGWRRRSWSPRPGSCRRSRTSRRPARRSPRRRACGPWG